MVGGINDAGYPAMRQAFVVQQDIGEEINEVRSNTPLPQFPIAVVEDVILNPAFLSEEEKTEIRNSVDNPEMVDRMPRKSIIARIVTREAGRSSNKSSVFMPFNQYDLQPIKPGEQAVVFYTDPYRSNRIGFWMCRLAEPNDVDDLNYTHGDRRYDDNIKRPTSERFDGQNLTEKPGFPNGDGENDDSRTLGGEKDFENIVKKAKASQYHVNEPVPRYTPRPGDRIIQGSNNSRIVLGTDRNGPATTAPKAFSGAIDLVVGVGSVPKDRETPKENSPRVVKNTRGLLETEKVPQKRGFKDNPLEGDPNFQNDKSRIYLSMNGNADDDFEIDIPTVDRTSGESPCIVLKTNQARIECREDLKIRVGEENGASVIIKADGNIIFVPGDNGIIKLGKNADKAILVQNIALAQGGTVLGQGILSTMGGQVGIGGSTGTFSKKVLIE